MGFYVSAHDLMVFETFSRTPTKICTYCLDRNRNDTFSDYNIITKTVSISVPHLHFLGHCTGGTGGTFYAFPFYERCEINSKNVDFSSFFHDFASFSDSRFARSRSIGFNFGRGNCINCDDAKHCILCVPLL